MKTKRGAAAILCVSLALVIAAAASAADAPARKKIMLGAFAAGGLATEQLRSLENIVCAELASNRGYEVVCPDDVGAVLKEQQLKMGLGACMEGDCMNVTGKLMESDLTVTGTLETKDGRYLTTLAISDTKTGRQLATASVTTAQELEKLVGKVKGLVGDLYKNLDAPPPPAEKPVAPKAPDGAKK